MAEDADGDRRVAILTAIVLVKLADAVTNKDWDALKPDLDELRQLIRQRYGANAV